MAEATLTSKWQMVLPRTIREHLKLTPGDRVDFLIRDDGEVVVRPVSLHWTDIGGLLRRPGRKPVSVAEMGQVVRRRARASA